LSLWFFLTFICIKVSAFVIVNNSCRKLRLNVVNSCGHRIVFFASIKFSGQVLWQRFQAIAMKMIMIFCSCYKANFVITWNKLLVRHWIISISMDSLFVHIKSNINIKASIVTVTVTCRTAIEALFLNSLLLMVQIESLSCSFTFTCPFLLNVEFLI
jgi:hypothetical protein